MEKIKKIINLENLLSFFIIICPVLDITSFLFRNKFLTNYSVATFVRPIIPVLVFGCIFIKEKAKLKTVGIIGLYSIYAIIHLYIFKKMMMGCTYGTVIHEAQYIVNYSFMILNLYIFNKVFDNNNKQAVSNRAYGQRYVRGVHRSRNASGWYGKYP